jgi:hypothetical protein
MINMNIFFNFVKILNEYYVFKVGLSKFMEFKQAHNLLYSL